MTASVDEDLVKILLNHTIKTDTRLQGWKYVLSLTGSEEGVRRLISEKFGTFLLTYLHDPLAERETLNLAYRCLINIASTVQGSSFLLAEEKFLAINLLRDICDPSSGFIESKCYILSNLSHNCNLMKQEEVLPAFPDLWGKHLKSCFCSSDGEIRDKYEFLALVFSNISSTPEGRKLLTEDESFPSTFLLGLNPAEPATRRLGMALTIRNFCSDTSCHRRLLMDLPSLLLPLMGPEEFDEETMVKLPVECQYLEETKQREALPEIRKALVQALSLLCYTEEGWNSLKNQGVYYVIRELHLWEKDPDVCEAIETLVGFLLVENYTSPSSHQLASVVPEETDLLQDIADLVVQ